MAETDIYSRKEMRMLLEALDADNTGIGRKARKTVVERYDWDRAAGILQQVYEEVL